MEKINFLEIEKAVIEKYRSLVKAEGKEPSAFSALAARMATMAIQEYHKQVNKGD